MSRWILRRLLQGVITLAVVMVLLFLLMRLTPGDPLGGIAGDRLMSPEEMQLLRARYGLDQPILQQFMTFARGAVQGDFGTSIHRYPDRVGPLIRDRLPASILLGGTVLLLNFTIGIGLGVLQAVHRGSRFDRWLTRISLAAWALPSFWLGLVLIAVFSLTLGLFPAGQMQDPLLPADAGPLTRLVDLLHHLALPALTLSAVSLAAGMRFQRTAMLEVLRLDFVRAARARGLPERRVIWVHAWRNALSPVVTLLGLWLPMLVAGSIYVESIFNWPGLGSLAAEAISGRDYPLLLGTAMLTSVLVVAGGVIADLGYLLVDPRVRDS
ncbi:MAG: ABC transporter permease [Gemmatimonadota bacterium]|nr:ABC transporter permease [Gemmatimonadota bacterium]